MMAWLIVYLSLAVWGWFNQQFLPAALLAMTIVLSDRLPWRWSIGLTQFYRVGDLCSLLIVAVLLYGYFAQTTQKTVFIILQWLPFCFAPLLLVQLLSRQRRLPLGALFYSVRNRPLESMTWLDVKMPLAGIALLSAAAGNDQTGVYFFVISAILILLLWSSRSQRSSIFLWFAVISLASVLAFFGQRQLHVLHSLLEEKALDWFSDWKTDPFKTHTSIGDIGELKLSEEIVYRIRADQPTLLLQSSYDRYLGQSWYASKRAFKAVVWRDEVSDSALKQMSVYQFNQSETILPLPAGTKAIKGLEGAILQATELGTVKLSEVPDFLNFKVDYSGRQAGAVGLYDLELPAQHRDWLRALKQTLELDGRSAKMVAETIEHYFHQHFRYTLFLGGNQNADQALREFILQRKAGHCEYFAVASVLLLRSYGIPARLANGYAMQEYDDRSQLFIVRKRHAHAWAIAYIDGYWQPVDSTPSQWLEIEEENVDVLQPLYDWFSALWFDYQRWRYQHAQSEGAGEQMLWLLPAILLGVYLFWRLYRAKRYLAKPALLPADDTCSDQAVGLDSEFYLIEQALQNTERKRLDNESLKTWVERIGDPKLIDLMQLHYRYRFDPDGVTVQQRNALSQAVLDWLEHYSVFGV